MHPVSGEEYQRLINTNRAKTYAVMAIRFDEDNGMGHKWARVAQI
jgi:hypothetical protein